MGAGELFLFTIVLWLVVRRLIKDRKKVALPLTHLLRLRIEQHEIK